MVTEELFDILSYMEKIGMRNKLAKNNGFRTVFCSGPESIQGVMQEFQKTANFIMVDDTTSQNTFSSGVTFFKKDVYTVFVLAGYRFDDMKDRQAKLNLCRRIFRQIHSKMIYDKSNMTYGDKLEYLEVNKVYSNEIGRYAMNGVTGLYFMVQNVQPVELVYNAEDWGDGIV
ncbi:MAG: hypothetical protein PHC48_10375 [Prevotella sp.]|nr:hypothetical protein [Prevotella sp.]